MKTTRILAAVAAGAVLLSGGLLTGCKDRLALEGLSSSGAGTRGDGTVPGGNDMLNEALPSNFEHLHLATFIIFLAAIAHTFLAPVFIRVSNRLEKEELGSKRLSARSTKVQMLRLLGKVEVVFGFWAIPLLAVIALSNGWAAAKAYIVTGVDFTEPMFVAVMMAISASRPVVWMAEQLMSKFPGLGGQNVMAWWVAILTLAPLLAPIITGAAAMTIGALLLGQKFYDRKPGAALSYATLGLLFVNISAGGIFSHVANSQLFGPGDEWNRGASYIFYQFGWKALCAVLTANVLYLFIFRQELRTLDTQPASPERGVNAGLYRRPDRIPAWIIFIHVVFMLWTVANRNDPVLFGGGFLFFVAFTEATEHYQNRLKYRQPFLVGFFLAGLLVHAGFQSWWVESILKGMGPMQTMLSTSLLTAFNHNATITSVASAVAASSGEIKYALIAGIAAGGGITLIANAPNPAGHSLLIRYFPQGISAPRLFLAAIFPTVIMLLYFWIFRSIGT